MISTMTDHPAPLDDVRTFRDRYARGGYTWTMRVNQYAAAHLALGAIRWGLSPKRITIVYLGVGLFTSLLFSALYTVSPVGASICGLVGWQLAYTLDCLDGQVARATGRSSPQGGVLDLLVDLLVHASVMVALFPIVVGTLDPRWQIPVAVVLSCGWLISPYFCGVAAILPSATNPRRQSLMLRLISGGRDYGLQVALLPILLLVDARAALAVLALFVALDYLALIKGIVEFASGRRETL